VGFVLGIDHNKTRESLKPLSQSQWFYLFIQLNMSKANKSNEKMAFIGSSLPSFGSYFMSPLEKLFSHMEEDSNEQKYSRNIIGDNWIATWSLRTISG